MSAARGPHRELPASRFYWGTVDASALPRGVGRDDERLGFLLEPLLPQPLDELKVVFQPLGERRFLACAMPRDRLHEEGGADALTLSPQDIPDFVGGGVDPASLNLLVGELTPEPVRRLRRRHALLLAALSVASALLIGIGFEARASQLVNLEAQRDDEAERIVELVVPSGGSPSALPPSLRLEAELRVLERTRRSPAGSGVQVDSVADLSGLLSAWPEGLGIETESIHVNADSMIVQGVVPESDHAQQLATAMEALAGWRARPPTIRSSGSSLRATLHLDREDAP
jgi:hypothetical protein